MWNVHSGNVGWLLQGCGASREVMGGGWVGHVGVEVVEEGREKC